MSTSPNPPPSPPTAAFPVLLRSIGSPTALAEAHTPGRVHRSPRRPALTDRPPRHHRRAHPSPHEPPIPTRRGDLSQGREGAPTYLACADVHTSTSSVGWIAAHVVHVGQLLTGRSGVVQRREVRGCILHGVEQEVGLSNATAFVAVCSSIWRRCLQQRCSTVMDAAKNISRR